MSINQQQYVKRLNDKVNDFSGRFMSDSKWLKLFKTLSEHDSLIRRCITIDIYESRERELEIPSIKLFDNFFHAKGIKDVPPSGPMLFREIQELRFPATWTMPKFMRTEVIEPIVYRQSLNEIEGLISGLGMLEMEIANNQLRVYGYR